MRDVISYRVTSAISESSSQKIRSRMGWSDEIMQHVTSGGTIHTAKNRAAKILSIMLDEGVEIVEIQRGEHGR